MENASKALFIAAGVILGVLVLSVAVALFMMFGNYSNDVINKINEAKLIEYNNNYLKYDNHLNYEGLQKVTVTAYDVVTMANFAKLSNKDFKEDDLSIASDLSDYVQIIVKLKNKQPDNNFEKKTQKQYNDFIKDNSTKINNVGQVELVYFKCKVSQNSVTHRVNKVEIEEI